jgi:hypothetical protein
MEPWQEGDAIQGDLDEIILNLMVSTILKWLRFRVVRWMHYLHHFDYLALLGFHGYITHSL